MIASTVSSTPSAGLAPKTLTTPPMNHSNSQDAGTSSRISPARLAALDESLEDSADAALEFRRVDSSALARKHHEVVAHDHERPDRACERFLHGNVLEPRGCQSIPGLLDGDPPQRLEQRLAVREVAIDGRARDAGGGRHIAHAGCLPFSRQRTGSGLENRRRDPLPQRRSGRGMRHRHPILRLGSGGMRYQCLITSN